MPRDPGAAGRRPSRRARRVPRVPGVGGRHRGGRGSGERAGNGGVVTTFDLDDDVFGAPGAGASGVALEDTDPDDLVDAVRRFARDDGLIDRTVTRRVIAEFAQRRPLPGGDASVDLLTPRETDIVRLLARGLSDAETAAELVVETSTVKSHLGRAMAKVGTR